MGGPRPHAGNVLSPTCGAAWLIVQADSTENWDDDFEFQPARESQPNAESAKDLGGASAASLLQDKKNTLQESELRFWAEPGPSTPSKRAAPAAHAANEENWDDDFQDSTDSPLRQHSHDALSRSLRRRRPTLPETENWDDDFEDKQGSPTAARRSAKWDSSSDEDVELGFADREEDRTVTSRSRRSALSTMLANESPPPPVPPIPASFMDSRLDPHPFPRSPTASVFSVPLSNKR